jgi:hypothetical protein
MHANRCANTHCNKHAFFNMRVRIIADFSCVNVEEGVYSYAKKWVCIHMLNTDLFCHRATSWISYQLNAPCELMQTLVIDVLEE